MAGSDAPDRSLPPRPPITACCGFTRLLMATAAFAADVARDSVGSSRHGRPVVSRARAARNDAAYKGHLTGCDLAQARRSLTGAAILARRRSSPSRAFSLNLHRPGAVHGRSCSPIGCEHAFCFGPRRRRASARFRPKPADPRRAVLYRGELPRGDAAWAFSALGDRHARRVVSALSTAACSFERSRASAAVWRFLQHSLPAGCLACFRSARAMNEHAARARESE